MAANTSTIVIHNPKHHFLIKSSSKTSTSSKPSSLPVSQTSKPSIEPAKSLSLAKNFVLAGTVLSPLASSPLALAAKQIAESPQEDNRGLILIVPVLGAVGWVLFNILGPALNQLNRMRSEKSTIVGLGLGGLITAATSSWVVPSAAAAASEVIENEGASGGGNQGLLPLIVAGAVALEVVLLKTMQSKYEEEGSSH